MAVGFAPVDPVENLRRTYHAVQQLQASLTNARKSFDDRRLKQLDTDIANAWIISEEIRRRIEEVGKALKETKQP